ncbi:hypothetical protein GF312_20755 [Candidatus Poribacteria bacterium]|nr:hypothetical protein [Candidatus Poribacteria bacterium]
MKIWKIAILVDDMEAAVKLYNEVLGMEIVERLPLGEAGECVFVDAGGVRLELIPKAAFEGDEKLGVPGFHHISFQVDDVEEAARELKAKGVKFIKEPFEAMPGMTLAFFDGLNGVNLQLLNWEKEDE